MRRGGLLVLGLCVLAAACARADTTAGGQPSAPPTVAAEASAAASEEAASPGVPDNLDFRADLVGGGQLDAGELAGRDVVLWFWAPW